MTKTENGIDNQVSKAKKYTTDSIEHSLYENNTDNDKQSLFNFLAVKSIDALISVLLFTKKNLYPLITKEGRILKNAYKEKQNAINLLEEAKYSNFNTIEHEKDKREINFIKSKDGSYFTLRETIKGKISKEIDFCPKTLEIYSIKDKVTYTSHTYKVKNMYKFNSEGKLEYYANKTFLKNN